MDDPDLDHDVPPVNRGDPPSGPPAAFPPPPPAWPPAPGPEGTAPTPFPPRSAGRRRTVAVAVAAGILLVLAAVVVPVAVLTRRGGSPSSASPAASPGTGAGASGAAAVYRQALSVARGSAGVHYVAVTTGGLATQRIVGDAGRDSGTQDITFSSSFGTERFTLRLLSGTVYFRGNAPALEDQLGVPAASASRLDGSWVSVVRGDGPYTVVAPGITVADQLTQMPLTPSSTQSLTAGGRRMTRIGGTVPPQQGAPQGTGHLDVDDSTHLPAVYASTVTDGVVTLSTTTTFSAWGTAPTVSAPDGAVAWSTLGASPPPGGYGGGGAGPAPTPQVV